MSNLAKYQIDRKGTKALMQSSRVQDACYRGAKIIEAEARSTPIDSGKTDRGREVDEYRARFNTIKSKVTLDKAKSEKTRYGATVYNDYPRESRYGGRGRILYKAMSALNGRRL